MTSNILMEGEFRVQEGSPLIGKSITEIENEYGVKIIKICNPFPSPAEEKEPEPQLKLYPSLYLQVRASYEDMKRFSLELVNY